MLRTRGRLPPNAGKVRHPCGMNLLSMCCGTTLTGYYAPGQPEASNTATGSR
jgi:hypothetical protein